MDLQSYQKRTWAEVDLDILAENLKSLRAKVKNGALLCAVVKADGYGHGAIALSRLYENMGLEWLAVSNVEEALELRESGIKTNILVLGYTPPASAAFLGKYGISQCVMSREYAEELSRSALDAKQRVKIHIKLDTGMGRLGFFAKNEAATRQAALNDIEYVCSLSGLVPEGIFTHFSSSDEGDSGEDFTLDQLNSFESAVCELEKRGLRFEIKHAAASAAILDYPSSHFNMVRAGIALYGSLPSDKIKNAVSLRPAMKLKTVAVQVKKLFKGETLSYGRTYTADKDRIVATIPIGYADGFLRRGSECGVEVELRGKRAAIIGRICMDQCIIDVTDIEGASVGDEVTVFGGIISVEELAARNGTIPYEIYCLLSKRIPRVYLSGGEAVHIVDYILNIHE